MKKIRIIILTTALSVLSAGLCFAQAPELQYDFAYQLYMNGNFSLAETLFNSYVAARPEDPVSGNASFMAGETEYNTGQYKRALDSFISIIEKYPATINKYKKELYYRVAECYFQLKDYDNSAKYINILLKEYPDSYLAKDAYLLLGENYFLTSKYDGAVDALNRMENYTEYSHFDYVYYLKGRVYYEKALLEGADKEKNCREAIKYFDRVKNEFSGSKILNHSEFRKANAYYALKQYDSSIKIIGSLLDREKDLKFKALMKYFIAWNYYMVKQYKKAISTYDTVISGYDGDLLTIWSEYKKGLCLEALGDTQAALSQYKRVIEKYPDTVPSAYAQYALSQNLYNQKDYYGALSGFELVTSKYNVEELSRAANFMAADIQVILNNFSRAKAIYGSIERSYPADKYTALYMQAWCLYKEADYAGSTKMYESIISDEKAPEEMKAKSTVKIGDNYYETDQADLAARYYDRAINECSKYPGLVAEAYYGKGWILFSRNKYAEARDLFAKVRQLAPDNETKFKADFMKANTLYSDYKFDEALSIYTDIMNARSIPEAMRDDSIFYAAWCWYRKEKFDRAVELWRKYRDLIPDPARKAEAQYRIGWAYFRQNDFDRAITEFTVITDSYKTTHFYQEALLKIGDSYYNKKDYSRAIELYKTLVDNFPQHYRIGEALYGIQWSYYQLNEPEKAIELSKQFVDKYPDSSFTPEIQYRIAEHYFNTGNFETAVREFTRFTEKNPKHSLSDNAYYWIGVSQLSLKKYPEAVSAFKELLQKFPDTQFADKAVFKAAGAYYQLHDYPNAVENYKKFIDTYKGNKYIAEAYFNLAMSYKRNNDIENTKVWYIKFITEFKDSELYERALMNLGYLYQDNREYDPAIETFRTAAALGKGKAVEAQFWIADCLNSKKEYDAAVAEYVKVSDNFKTEELWVISALDAAGKIYEKKGDLKGAIKMYKKILNATKQEKYLETARKRIELLEEQYRLLNPAEGAAKGKKK